MSNKTCEFCGSPSSPDLDIHAKKVGCKALCKSCSKKNFPVMVEPITRITNGTGTTYGAEFELNPDWETYIRLLGDGDVEISEDHSLRGKSCEIVTPILWDSNFENWILERFTGAKCNLYSRAGVHYWFETKLLGWHGLNAFLYYVAINEGWYAGLVPKHRRPGTYNQSGKPMSMGKWTPHIYRNKTDFIKSIYGDCGYMLRACNAVVSFGKDPSTKKAKMLKEKVSIMKGQKRANDKGDKTYPRGPVCRYWWINVHGHFRSGAIEVRLHQGTCDPDVIINTMRSWRIWIDFFSCAKNHKYRPLDPLPLYLQKYWESVRMACKEINYSNLPLAEDFT